MPPRKWGKKGATTATKQQQLPPPEPPGPDAPMQEKLRWLADQEIERRKAAIRAIQAAEVEGVLSRIRLVRTYISKEQEETCALQYFQENLPNVSVVPNEKQDELELKWNEWDNHIYGDQRDDKVSRASITSLATAAGFHFSGDSVQKNFIESTFDFNNFATSSHLSFGMTPKTVRVPKNGEMLLSVHGSPLGVYKEENLAAITESGNGSEELPRDATGPL
ncbi:hypothetical protein ACQ4PT_044842 [Festuca glaucescens]